MKKSLLKDLRLLIVDDEPDVLALLREEILDACPDCRIDEAGTYEMVTGNFFQCPFRPQLVEQGGAVLEDF